MSEQNSVNAPITTFMKTVLDDPTKETAVDTLVSNASLTSATVASGDLVIIQDIDDSKNVRTVTAQDIADLATPAGGAAPGDATYILQTADVDLANAQDLGSLATGILKSTTTTGVVSIAIAGTDYVTPAGAVTSLTGTANEVTVSAATGAVTVSLPDTVRIATSLLDANSVTILGMSATASAVNYLAIGNKATGTDPDIIPAGTDTNIGLGFGSKGTGQFSFYGSAGNVSSIRMLPNAGLTGKFITFATPADGAVTSYTMTLPPAQGGLGTVLTNDGSGGLSWGAAGSPGVTSLTGTANEVTVSAATGAVTVSLPDTIRVATSLLDTNSLTILGMTAAATAVNYLAVGNSATTDPLTLTATGTDSNIQVNYISKGVGDHVFYADGLELLKLDATASAVNYLEIVNTTTGNGPVLRVAGDDANAELILISKGTSGISLRAGTEAIMLLSPIASAVNYMEIKNAATGNQIGIFARGSDADVGLSMTTKGTGQLTIATGALTTPISIDSGTSGQHTTQLAFANTAAARTVTFPDADGTILFETTGTWTPTLYGATTAGTPTYVAQNGYYTRIGNFVFIFGSVEVSAHTGTGNTLIGGLPFTIKSQTNGSVYGSLTVNSTWAYPAGTTSLALHGLNNTTIAAIEVSGSSTGTYNLQITNAACRVEFSLCYQI